MKFDCGQFSGVCTCGRTHSLSTQEIFLEMGALKKLPILLREDGYNHPVIVCDGNTWKAAGKQTASLIPGSRVVCLPEENLHADETAVEKVLGELKGADDVLLAVGSGTIHDITRYAANERTLPFYSIPTAASVDGFVSTVAAMTWHGFKKSFSAVAPRFVIADTGIFSKAPYRLTASGVSDLLGKYTAIADWKIANVVVGEYICKRICQMEMEAVNRVIDSIDGLRAGTPQAYEELMYGLLLSGLAMQMVGNSRPASGAEHHISHFWEMELINPHIDAYHGEKVSAGLLICLKEYQEILDTIRSGRIQVEPYQGFPVDELKRSIQNETIYNQIVEENTPDPLAAVQPEELRRKLGRIAEILAVLPSPQEAEQTLNRAGAVCAPEQIGISQDLLEPSVRLSPFVRCRLTLMRLKHMLSAG